MRERERERERERANQYRNSCDVVVINWIKSICFMLGMKVNFNDINNTS